ncbi:hypothetical protein C8J55DRAFT_493194 [Lentinula edodes]|uniref:Uncharacterized protein n=1 Tax=Lentinula lateritia TaxID=40482 RepID=A0A9W9DE38_9AGAR|nr:hypothetical protein C8J55DRAFT_493194 [Lentinula edodes]
MTPQTNQLTALFLYVVPSSQYTPQCTLQSRRAVKFTGSVRLLEAARHSKSMAALSHCDHIQVRIDFAIAIAIGRRVHCHSLCMLLHASCIEKGFEKSVKGAKYGDLSPLYLARYVILHKVECKPRDKRCMVDVGFGNREKKRQMRTQNKMNLNTSPTIYRPEKMASPGYQHICRDRVILGTRGRPVTEHHPLPLNLQSGQDSIESLVFLNDYPHRKGSRTSELSAVIANMGAEEAVQSRSIWIFDDAKESGSRKTRYFDTHREGYQKRKVICRE